MDKPKVKIVYKKLQERLDRNVSGAPPHDTFFELLEILFGEDSARLAAHMPMMPATLESIAKRAGESPGRAQSLLESMCERGLVMDMPSLKSGKTYYYLLPPVIGFFEFSLMRERDDIPQKHVAELMRKYEDDTDFFKGLFGFPTKFSRVLPHESAVAAGIQPEVLDYERATEVIGKARSHAIALCFCRHGKRLTDHNCGRPEDICMSFDGGADYFIRHGIAKKASKEETLEKLEIARSHGMVQLTDNVLKDPGYICNCCGCCCGMLRSVNHRGLKLTVHTSDYIAKVADACTGCGKCAKACPVSAIKIADRPGAAQPVEGEKKKKKIAKVDESICLGCGVCVRDCKPVAIQLHKRRKRALTPENTLERVLVSAIEQGKLEQLLFDDVQGPGGDFLKTFVGAFLRMPAAKRLLLTKEVKSRFLEFANRSAG